MFAGCERGEAFKIRPYILFPSGDCRSRGLHSRAIRWQNAGQRIKWLTPRSLSQTQTHDDCLTMPLHDVTLSLSDLLLLLCVRSAKAELSFPRLWDRAFMQGAGGARACPWPGAGTTTALAYPSRPPQQLIHDDARPRHLLFFILRPPPHPLYIKPVAAFPPLFSAISSLAAHTPLLSVPALYCPISAPTPPRETAPWSHAKRIPYDVCAGPANCDSICSFALSDHRARRTQPQELC